MRLSDHAALAHATAIADAVAVAFVFDPAILDRLEDRAHRRVQFLHDSLREVGAGLRERGSELVVAVGDPVAEIVRLAKALQVDVVVAARDRDPFAIERDARVQRALEQIGVRFETVKDVTVLESGEVTQEDGRSYRVFTPYSRAWRTKFEAVAGAESKDPNFERLMPASELSSFAVDWSLDRLGFESVELWLESGESAGRRRLEAMRAKLDSYGEQRDFPAVDGTSGLSVHLRFGTVSIRECVRVALDGGSKGAEKWLSELIWREFYHDILGNHPHVVERTFQPEYADIEYPGEQGHYQAWEVGQTGYPIVDAAMRCLNVTGWMHNRLRMIVASFLTKDLLLDYRLGEAYFARKLLDYELASNNGGWQWAASVGCDAQPYFRIFNPYLQSAKFDPEGAFIRKWVPELADLPTQWLHDPSAVGAFDLASHGVEMGRNYPAPIVDHSVQRVRAIAMLESCRAKRS